MIVDILSCDSLQYEILEIQLIYKNATKMDEYKDYSHCYLAQKKIASVDSRDVLLYPVDVVAYAKLQPDASLFKFTSFKHGTSSM